MVILDIGTVICNGGVQLLPNQKGGVCKNVMGRL